MHKAKFALLGATAFFALAGSANAALLDAPVPVNATVIYNGLQWAWAAPVAPSYVDLSYQSQFGWHLPSADELLLAPNAQQFIYSGANTPFGGSDPVSGANWQYTDGQTGFGALAAPYFNNSYYHGDFCNGPGSGCSFNNEIAWNSPEFYSESLVVRTAPGVPEPATWAMMLAGFGAVGFAMRRRRNVAVSFA